ncbi:MAG: N-acetyl-gamma-glutamyl-phosphate reductase [Patescibacteria group bacterium]
MSKKINVSIIGATGYTGLELLRLIVGHPHIELKFLVSASNSGKKISDVYPHLKNVCDMELTNPSLQKIAEESDCVFLALPYFEAQKIVPKLIGKTKIIDLSADFRIQDKNLYKKYYGNDHSFVEGISKFVYGIPEFDKEKIASSENIANPGCFAIAILLAISPIKHLVEHADIFAITGSSGSGKTPSAGTHHPVRNHNVKSYKMGTHQHVAEVIQQLDISADRLTFVPTSGPFTRGIHLTAFVDLKGSKDDVMNLFNKAYKAQPFVRIKDEVQLADVIGSNFCDISIHFDNGKLIVQSVIDNLVKGAAGNAIQNFNIMFGFDETVCLKAFSPLYP